MSELARQLEEFKADFASKAAPEIVALFEHKTAELQQEGLAKRALQVGQTAPKFNLPQVNGSEFSLADALGEAALVVAFYRGGWCPYCNLELRALQKVLPQIESLGGRLVAVSPETPDNSLSTVQKNELEFAVLSDIGNKVAKQYGLVFALAEELRPIYQQFGIDLAAHNNDDTYELPLPATFVLDRQGIVRYAFVDADYTIRAEPSDILAALEQTSQ